MPTLRPDQCWQQLASFDIGPALSVFDQMPFKLTHGKNKDRTVNPYYFTVGPNAPMPPEVINLVDQVLETIGGEPHRFIFRKLGKRQSLPPHVDDMLDHEYDWRRFQVPIITDPNIVMRWPDDNQEVHLEAGNLYEVRADRLHEVVNNADIERVQLQIDQINATI